MWGNIHSFEQTFWKNGEILLFLYGASAMLVWPCHDWERGGNSLINLGIFFFRLLFRTIMASSLTSGCADAFSTHIWNGWRKRSYLLEDFSQPVAIWRRYVTGRDGWEMGTVVYFWLHDPCLCLPPGPLYGLHTKRKTSHKGSTQAAYKAGQVINGVRGPVGNELGTSFSRMMQNNTREGCSQMQDNHCYERPTTWLV